jgi:hypothetical protein
MLDIIAPDQNQPAAGVHGGRVDDCKPWLPATRAERAERPGAKQLAPEQGACADEAQHQHECNDESPRVRHAAKH